MTGPTDATVHVRYLVDDVQAAIDFYTTHLGFTVNTAFLPAFADVQRGNLRLLPHDEPMVSDSASRIAIQDQLDRAFRQLSVEHRTVVVLVHYLGQTPSEAAETMGTPVGTARSRLHYALEHLRSALEADARATITRGTA